MDNKGERGHTLGPQPAAGGGGSVCLPIPPPHRTSRSLPTIHWGVCSAWSLPRPSISISCSAAFFSGFSLSSLLAISTFHDLIFSTCLFIPLCLIIINVDMCCLHVKLSSLVPLHRSHFASQCCVGVKAFCSPAEAALLTCCSVIPSKH